jgi:hypothetical protein
MLRNTNGNARMVFPLSISIPAETANARPGRSTHEPQAEVIPTKILMTRPTASADHSPRIASQIPDAIPPTRSKSIEEASKG